MIHAETFTRTTLPAKGYRPKRAAEIFAKFATINAVEFWERGGDPSARPEPRTGVACYVMSSGGKWGRSSETRIDPIDEAARREALLEGRRDRAVWPPFPGSNS